MREGSTFFVMWVFTVLKPKMTEKKKVTLLLKYSYWREKVLRINDQPRENALLFTQILLTLQVTVWRDRVREFVSGYWREKTFSILVLGTPKCRYLICRWHHFNQDHEFLFHSYGVNTCSVCLEGLVGKDPVKIPCSHVICLTCISEWTSQERSCPMCKRQIPEDFRIQSSKIIRLDFFFLLKWLVSQWRVEDRKLQT